MGHDRKRFLAAIGREVFVDRMRLRQPIEPTVSDGTEAMFEAIAAMIDEALDVHAETWHDAPPRRTDG